MRFRPGQHLRRAADFQHVRAVGRRFDCGAFTLWHAPRRTNDAPPTASVTAAETTPTSTGVHADAAGSPHLKQEEVVTPITLKSPAPARAGFVASRAAVGGAIARNRAKRRLREAFRRQQLLTPAGHDLILVARAAAGRLAFAELERRLADACRKIFPSTK
jgi:ribonuclease P protein component